MMQYGWDGGGTGAFLGMLLMVLFTAAVVVGIVLVIRALMSGPQHAHGQWAAPPTSLAPTAPTSSALHILEERYARGDIDREEFLERKQHLSA